MTAADPPAPGSDGRVAENPLAGLEVALPDRSLAALLRRRTRPLLPVLGLLTGLLLWEAATDLFRLPQYLLPAPSRVILFTFERWELLAQHAQATIAATIGGLALAIIFGVLVSTAMVLMPLFEETTYPLFVATQVIPKVAIAPLAVVYLGYGLSSKSFIAFLVSFFPLVINTTLGLKSVDPDLLDLLKSLKASQRTVLLKVRVFTALPYFIEGTKIAVTLAIIGAVVGEFQAGNEGLGYLIAGALTQFNMVLSFSALLVLTVIGVILFKLVDVVGVALTPWMQR